MCLWCFKFRCNILISGKIIKEMPGSVASGTHCSKRPASRPTFLVPGREPPVATEQEVGWVCEVVWRFWSTQESNLALRKVRGSCLGLPLQRQNWMTAGDRGGHGPKEGGNVTEQEEFTYQI